MTTIVPMQFYPPKTEGWSHNIKAADGYFYGCPEKLITLFQKGQPIDVEITIKEKDGKTYRDIKRVVPNGQGVSPSSPLVAAQKRDQIYGRYGGTDDATAERIFTCGLLNALAPAVYAKHGSCDAATMVAMTNAIRQAWAATFGAKTDAQ